MRRLRVLLRPATGWGKTLLWSLLLIAGTFVLLAVVGRLSALAGCSASEVGRCAFEIRGFDAGGALNTLAIIGFGSLFLLVPVATGLAAVSALACTLRRKW